MFTGIIEALGTIRHLKPGPGGDLEIGVFSEQLDFSDVRLGDSVAVNGVCLTVTRLAGKTFYADVSVETIRHSLFATMVVGTKVNLEKALTLSTRLGGHIVSGHVDGVGEVTQRRSEGSAIRFAIAAPNSVMRYIAEKGSITVDGTSLTVNATTADHFWLNIVPHTASETVINGYKVGSRVHLEVDILARYIERLLQSEGGGQASDKEQLTDPKSNKPDSKTISKAFLATHGFLR
ncbi:MAG: riboflavin synthase [Pseudomonadales bacterium]|nr:riboflavin synthase [Pseudomonadales bacterium]